MPRRVALVIGHSAKKRGAAGRAGIAEYDFNSILVPQVAHSLFANGIQGITFERTDDPYREAMGKLTNAINHADPDFVLSFHFDGSNDPCVRGASGRYWPGSEHGRIISEFMAAACSEAIKTKNRGAVAQSRSWNTPSASSDGLARTSGKPEPAGPPLYLLRDTKAPACIIESHYGSHLNESRAALRALNSGELAKQITQAVINYLKTLPEPEQKENGP